MTDARRDELVNIARILIGDDERERLQLASRLLHLAQERPNTEPAPAAEEVLNITEAQRKAIFAELGRYFLSNFSREARLRLLSSIVNRPVLSINDLTQAEASHVLTVLPWFGHCDLI